MDDSQQFDLKKPQMRSNRLNVLPTNLDQASLDSAVGLGRFPSWLHRKLPKGSAFTKTGEIIKENRLYTVCEEASCPNQLECWSKKTATFLILGKHCTRSCGFCDIDFSKTPKAPEADEPYRVAESVQQLGLRHVVITMVARDDLKDGGAAHLAVVIGAVRQLNPNVTVEVLTSDFGGNEQAWETVLNAKPEIFNHNIETVRELTHRVRHTATYDRTLQCLHYANQHKKIPSMMVKSGLMVGLGETEEQVQRTLQDLYDHGCEVVTIGQYLQPNRQKLLVKAFITPEQFKRFEEFGYRLGIKYMYCGPFVRSSYNANLVIDAATNKTINSE